LKLNLAKNNIIRETFIAHIDRRVLKATTNITFYTENNEYAAKQTRKQEPIYSMQGNLTYTFKNKKVNLQPGNYINIAAQTKHKVSWTAPDIETLWLVIFY